LFTKIKNEKKWRERKKKKKGNVFAVFGIRGQMPEIDAKTKVPMKYQNRTTLLLPCQIML